MAAPGLPTRRASAGTRLLRAGALLAVSILAALLFCSVLGGPCAWSFARSFSFAASCQASGKTGSGKKFFHNIIPGSAVKNEPFYVAIITPVIHYCMGGLLIDEDSACVGANDKAIPGLYAAGEVAGGVHGNNRLGGNSLLDCVVFGRVAGKAAAQWMLGSAMKDVDLQEITGGGLTGAVQSSKLAGGSYEDKMNSAPAAAKPAAAAAAPAAAAPAAGGGGGGITLADVAKHNTKSDCWVVVDGQVLDVTSFLSEHPGGELAILTFAGKDATEEFNMRLG